MSTYLIVGLGNPGSRYEDTRHNIGFMVVDALADELGVSFREKFKGEFAKGEHKGDDVILLKPHTFMNLSGESARKALDFFKVKLEHVLIIHDELDLPFKTNRIKIGGGTNGHNGLKSLHQHLGGGGYNRIRAGIDGDRRAQRPDQFVLSPFAPIEQAELPDVIKQLTKMALGVVSLGAQPAMNRFHKKKPKKPKAKKPRKDDAKAQQGRGSAKAKEPAQADTETKAPKPGAPDEPSGDTSS